MSHTIAGKTKLLQRVRRIKGQVASLEKALEADDECISILQQIAAVRGAVNGLMGHLLEEHLRMHLGEPAVSKKQYDEDLEQVITVLRSYLK